MNHLRRFLGLLAGGAVALLALAATAPAALAIRVPPPGGYGGTVQAPPQVHTIVTGGMPGWQITLIALAAALVAAAAAVLLDRAWATHRAAPRTTA